MALIVKKFRRKKLPKSASAILRRKKVPKTTKPRGGGLKALVVELLKKKYFLWLPLVIRSKNFRNYSHFHTLCTQFFPCGGGAERKKRYCLSLRYSYVVGGQPDGRSSVPNQGERCIISDFKMKQERSSFTGADGIGYYLYLCIYLCIRYNKK